MSTTSTDGLLTEYMPPNAIAVVGVGCKFPGADSVEEFWRMLDAGESKLSEPPSGRFPAHEHQRDTDKTVYFGNYLDDIASFDHRFFKKSGREAASLDPQQRLLLEVSYQALESAGFFGPRKPDLDVGCFIGVCASDYNDNVASHPANAFSALGTLRAFVPGRISHFFGLSGPSIALDTACSSSAVAIDAACKAILHGDCKSAIAGGVSIFTSPFFYQNLAAASFLSPTGASKSFDASADGYCRGEGVGLVVLKRLSDAVADGDNVLGTILATAVRQSSSKVPITVPYSPSQTELYRKLLTTAGIAAEDVTYVEAHGTGTPVGDPLEFGAIKEVFASGDRDVPLHFASVKGNIGHTEGASGVAGLIKTLLMMQYRAIPRQAHFQSPHPKISLVPGRMSIPTETIPWVADTLIACVNNYGAAGSIAAMLVREPPSKTALARSHRAVASNNLDKLPVIITANSVKSLGENAAKLLDYISFLRRGSASEVEILADLAFNLSERQNRTLPNMLATTASSLSELENQLQVVTFNSESPLCQISPKPNPVVIIFGGQTSRSVGLSKHVYDSSALLRKYLDECNGIIQGFSHPGIYPGIFATQPVDDVVSLQTMQFALHYACAQSWIACGLQIDCVLGHSFGQLVAMVIAGVLSLEDGLRLVYGRAVLMRQKWGSERGSMIALEADYETTKDLISIVQRLDISSDYRLEIACFNGPSSHVLVGSSAAVDAAHVQFMSRSPKGRAKVLNVTHGFHSRFSDPILADLEKLVEGLSFTKPRIHFETCSMGEAWFDITAKQVADHTRSPVYFEDAVKRIEARFGACTWLEAGSNSAVTSIARRALSSSNTDDHLFCPINLTRDDALNSVADTTVNLWRHGHHVQFWHFHHFQKQSYQALNLPPYQFEKTRHWLDFDLQAGISSELSQVPAKAPESLVVEPEPEPVLITLSEFQDGASRGPKKATFTIDPRSECWKVLVSGHAVLNEALCPATMYIELVMQAAKQIAAVENIACAPFARVDDLEISSPLGMGQDRIVQLVLSPSDQLGCKFDFAFVSQELPSTDKSITTELERTSKLLHRMQKNQDMGQMFTEMVTQPGGEAVQGKLVYKVFSRVVQYGDIYRGVRRVAGNSDGAVVADVVLPKAQPACTQDLISTPVAIDNFFQVPGLYANCLAPCPPDDVLVSTYVDRVQLSPDFGKAQAEGSSPGWDVFAISTATSDRESSNDIFVTDKITGQLVFVAFGAKFSRVRMASLAKILSRANPSDNSEAVSSKTSQRSSATAIKPATTEAAPLKAPSPASISLPSIAAAVNSILPSSPPVRLAIAPSVADELRDLLSKMTDVPADQLHDDTTLEELGIDSLMATEIVSEVNEVFKILIPQDQLQDMQTFSALCAYLDGYGAQQASQRVQGTPQVLKDPVVAVPFDQPTNPANRNIISNSESQPHASVAEPAVLQEQNERIDLIPRLAELLGNHLECPATDFNRLTNLIDRGLDSLLCMELMSDMEEMFGVAIDASSFTDTCTFGDLTDILINAAAPVENAATTEPSTADSSPTPSSGYSTDGTDSSVIIDNTRIPLKTEQLLSYPASPALASAAQEFEGIKGDFDKFAAMYGFSDFYTQVADKQADLVLAYVVEAFSDLGVDLSALGPGEKIPKIPVIARHDRMLGVFDKILQRGKLADYDGRQYVRSETIIDTTPSSSRFKDILAEFPQHAKEHTLLNICGSKMAAILSGKMDPLSILFGTKANRSVLDDVYATAPMFIINSQLLTSFLEKALSNSTPGPDGKYRIVELGAGTGATTRWVVDRLVQKGVPIEYTFTDISSALVSGAKRKFAGLDCMKYGTIDIEKPPATQHLGQYDIVLATNCIHATTNLHNSLTNINKLLRPHGFVSLVELTTRNYWLDMVFGLLDGWWLYDDGRPYVLATPEFWDDTMRQVGFQHVSWTGGHKRESEVCRVITGFKQPVQDASQHHSIPQEKAGGVETIVFTHTDKQLPLRADIHYPSSSQASAHRNWVTGLIVHGGGHVMLSRQDVRLRQIQLLLDNGVLPVSVDYRLCPETTILNGPLVDVATAYAWARNTLPDLKLTQTKINNLLDRDRAVVVGWSTGGTLAMSLAWTSVPRGIPAPDAILAFYCPTDYEDEFWRKPNVPDHSSGFANETYNVIDGVSPAPITAYNVPPKMMAAAGWIAPKDPRSRVVLHMNWHGQTLPVLFRGLPSGLDVPSHAATAYNKLEQPALDEVVRASPYAQIVKGNYKSPTHIVFGTGDDLIPWEQAQRTVDAMRNAGVQSGLTLGPGQPHLFDLFRDPDGSRWGYVMEGYKFLFEKIRRDINKYGTVVRFGPNAVMVSQPDAIEKIYGFKRRFEKSEFYDSIMPRIRGGKIPDVFATRDENIHRRMRRPVANLYSLTNLMSFEPVVNSTLQHLFQRLDELFLDKKVDVDLFKWTQYFMFDVLGEVTFSKELGCLDQGGDVEGVIENNWRYFNMIAANTQMPWLDYLWRDNPLIPVSAKRNPLVEFGAARIRERMSLIESGKGELDQKDFLSSFISENAKDHTLPAMFLPTWVNSNIVAGADTTSILSGALIYHLLKNPPSLAKLQKEIDDATAAGRLSKFATWKESKCLTYFDACVKEATRMHPPFALPFERVVPDCGLEIDGYHIPPGTRIGINPWSLHREVSLYGAEPDLWRPERWLCDEEKHAAMYNTLLTFGAGHRSCLGKHLAYFEIYKLIPSLLQRYNIQLVNQDEEWTVENKWLAKPSGFRVKLSTRS
ncbi:polyketide synthase [Colletotrichum scovillei]|uniref:Polyketide synthase n=1 Tax=Colletotrichum scovillei TaxID=1209932 RepID=A0A9P7RJ24_9PEZI|nr:polyketide synthase [Colletotrichum scovillei]